MLPSFLHVTSEHHRLPRQQDAARDATHLHPHDLAADGPRKKARLISLLPSEHPLAVFPPSRSRRCASGPTPARASLHLAFEQDGRDEWLLGHFAGGTPVLTNPQRRVFINLDNILTVERQGDLTTVVMVGGEKVCIDTMPGKMLIGAVAPPGPL